MPYQSQVVHLDGMDSWDLSYQWWAHLGLSQVVLPILSGTLRWDISAISDGTPQDYPRLSYQSQVVHWDGMDSWDLIYISDETTWDYSSGTLGWGFPTDPKWYLWWDGQLGFELSLMGSLSYRSQVVHWNGIKSYDFTAISDGTIWDYPN